MPNSNYKLVRLANGTFSIYSLAEDETFHPVVGPAAPQLFAAGLLGASLLAASVVPLSTLLSRTHAHPNPCPTALRPECRKYGQFRYSKAGSATLRMSRR